MIDSGEAESRAITGAVRGAIGQVRLDAGVNITGLLVDMGSAESVDYRQHFMCWQLTRVLRPSLTEKVSPAVVRSVVQQDGLWRAGSPLSDPLWMAIQGEGFTNSSGGAGIAGDTAGGYGRDRTVPRGFADPANVSSRQESCCTAQPACV